MPKKPLKGRNLGRGGANLSGDEIRILNEFGKEKGIGGLGNKLHTIISQTTNRLDSFAGHKGTVGLKPQTTRDAEGIVKPTLHLNGGRVTGIPDPLKGTDPVNLDYFRRHLDCNWFEQMAVDCLEDEQAAATGGILPWFWGYTVHPPSPSDTALRDPGDTVESTDSTGWFITWAFILEEAAHFNRVSWYISNRAMVFLVPGVTRMNLGLFDADGNLVWQLGGIEYSDALLDTVQSETFEEVALSSGEYRLAYFSPCCHETWSIPSESAYTFQIMNRGRFIDNAEIYRTGWLYPINDRTDPVLPDSLPGTLAPFDSTSVPIPLFFFSYE